MGVGMGVHGAVLYGGTDCMFHSKRWIKKPRRRAVWESANGVLGERKCIDLTAVLPPPGRRPNWGWCSLQHSSLNYALSHLVPPAPALVVSHSAFQIDKSLMGYWEMLKMYLKFFMLQLKCTHRKTMEKKLKSNDWNIKKERKKVKKRKRGIQEKES
jgi:hypothetical protein